jgi:hypothetical protein
LEHTEWLLLTQSGLSHWVNDFAHIALYNDHLHFVERDKFHVIFQRIIQYTPINILEIGMPEDNNQEKGTIMKRIITVTVASLLLGVSGIAAADPVTMVWTCTLNDGVAAEQSQAAGKKWVALVRKMTGNDEITSSWVTAVVGETGNFRWVDTYPSLEVWAAVQTAWANSEEAAALDEELETNETCSNSRLYRSVVVD